MRSAAAVSTLCVGLGMFMALSVLTVLCVSHSHGHLLAHVLLRRTDPPPASSDNPTTLSSTTGMGPTGSFSNNTDIMVPMNYTPPQENTTTTSPASEQNLTSTAANGTTPLNTTLSGNATVIANAAAPTIVSTLTNDTAPTNATIPAKAVAVNATDSTNKTASADSKLPINASTPTNATSIDQSAAPVNASSVLPASAPTNGTAAANATVDASTIVPGNATAVVNGTSPDPASNATVVPSSAAPPAPPATPAGPPPPPDPTATGPGIVHVVQIDHPDGFIIDVGDPKDAGNLPTDPDHPLQAFNQTGEMVASGTISYVHNSGICETTPGVNQYSGYITVDHNMSYFFWFFEARNSPETAPLALWLNGGPGCSSMIGLFQENGPCHFVNGSQEPTLNPYSWNEHANIIYVDQPVGTGFSFGDDQVTSTATAAPYMWTFLQTFYKQFPQYKNRDFGLWTESFGGHFAPEFAIYFEQQNSNIVAGRINATVINLIALGINNGWYDGAIGYKSYIEYAHDNTWNPLINDTVRDQLMDAYTKTCLPMLENCTGLVGSNKMCFDADETCSDIIYKPILNAKNFSMNDVRAPTNDPNPPDTFLHYLLRPDIQKAIGAQGTFTDCSDDPLRQMMYTGDNARSFLRTLSGVVQTGVQTVLWAGDADLAGNHVGGWESANALDWDGAKNFTGTKVAPYMINGTHQGYFKSVDNLSWLQVFHAGHEVPFYQPELSLQVFNQTMSKKGLSNT